jgi:hypothetical protein
MKKKTKKIIYNIDMGEGKATSTSLGGLKVRYRSFAFASLVENKEQSYI